MSELYTNLTLRLRYPPEYVLDKMEMYEIAAVMEYEYLAHKDDWEQARLVAYLVAQTNSTKSLKVTDIMQFYWEQQEEKKDTSVSDAEKERLQMKAKQYLNYKSNG